MRAPSLLAPLSLLLLAMSGCVTRATQEPCPGELQGVLRLRGEIVEGAACASAGGAATAVDLSVAVHFVGETEAAICLQRPMAEPLLGVRAGDTIDVSTPVRPATSSGCGCSVDVLERIAGTLAREGTVLTGFTGELTTAFHPADGSATCAATGASSTCAVPCTVRWTLTSG